MSGTDIGYADSSFCYAMSGTDIGYADLSLLCDVRVWPGLYLLHTGEILNEPLTQDHPLLTEVPSLPSRATVRGIPAT
eukprot:3387830-Rhodomonas_salina.2